MRTIPIVTLRPGQRTTISLPFRAGSGNFDLLREIRGERTRPTYDRQTKLFSVARDAGDQLIDGLVDEFGAAHVVIHGTLTTNCVSECWGANPDTQWDCKCGCAGSNHGTGHALRYEVQPGLSIDHEHTRAHYLVTLRGWEPITT